MTAANGRRVIEETTSLGMGILVAEPEDGAYQPVATVDTIREAREMAASDMRARMSRPEQGSDSLCPARYLVWARNAAGDYATVAEIEAN